MFALVTVPLFPTLSARCATCLPKREKLMLLEIVKYGTPALRQKGALIEQVTPTIKKLMGDMLETMYAFKGVGLAAQQVGLAVQLTVIDVRGVTDRLSSLEWDGKPVEVADFMPMVL